MSRLYAQVAPVYIQVSPITVVFQLVEGWRYDRGTVLRKVASPNNTLRMGRPKGEGVVVKHWIQEIPMAPSVIAITKVSRKRRSFEAADTPQKTQCLSEAEYSDDDSSSPKSLSPQMDDDRRAHHNELERRRRDHIKDHFMSLKDAIPLLEGEKSSRALILKRAVEYISMMQKQIAENQSDIAQLRQQNKELETQSKHL
ncbi:Protein max [Toxocara canis]|uniref:Protein max n=1 Tax=Toxocara canis TaxID=6265 RepID=A0A0B2V3H5_TOXCA|nr:Protein max [Toxocara canis]